MTENEQRPLASWVAVWLAALALGLMLAALPGCGGGGGGAAAPSDPPPAPVAGALSTAQPGDLVAYFKTRLQEQAAQGVAPPSGLAFSAGPQTTATPGGAAFSGAPQQELGVEEDDLLKTDGTMLYALHPSYADGTQTIPARLTSQRRQADGSLASPATATLNQDFRPQGMLLAAAASRLVVLGQKPAYDAFIAAFAPTALLPSPDVPHERRVSLDVFTTADAGRPSQISRIEIDGSMVGSRMIGNVLYVVSHWSPDVSPYILPAKPTREQADARLAGLTSAELLPKIRIDGGAAQPLVSESDCLLQPANASLGLQLTTITAFDLSNGALTRKSRCFVGGVEALYMSPTHVYLASSRQYWTATATASTIFPATARTDIHKFALQGLQVDYKASGDVAGHLGWDQEKKPYRMSEFNGDLRVLSFTGESGWFGAITTFAPPTQSASPATLTVLREDTAARSLKTIATLPNTQRAAPLGKPGEQVYAVHFAGARAYVVTFRRTDPLYVIDLSSPTDPRTVGELQVPGYSDYLFPLAGGKLLGVGKDATSDGRVGGIKVALFDVADPAQPRVLVSRTLGGSGSSSALDFSRHGISLATDGARVHVALPVRVTDNLSRSSEQGLARYLVDTGAGTLDEQPFTLATRFDGSLQDSSRYARFDLGAERAVRIADSTYYLSGGMISRVP